MKRTLAAAVFALGLSAFVLPAPPAMAKTYTYKAACDQSYSKQGEANDDLRDQKKANQ
jgi:hypothetical protein